MKLKWVSSLGERMGRQGAGVPPLGAPFSESFPFGHACAHHHRALLLWSPGEQDGHLRQLQGLVCGWWEGLSLQPCLPGPELLS